MPVDLSKTLVVGISSSALFDLREADAVFRDHGIRAYREHMVSLEDAPLLPGTGFALVKALLALNRHAPEGAPPLVEVVVMSRNSPETGVRVMNAVDDHELAITRYALTGGEALSGYAAAFGLDLFLSTSAADVQKVVDADACAAAVLYDPPNGYEPPDDQVRFAFDADAVLFAEDSEIIYKRDGLPAFHEAEGAARDVPLAEGPFAAFLRKLALLKANLPEKVEYSPVRIAVVTARNAPAAARVIKTLRAWNVYADEAFFLGGLDKGPILKELRPHIFFDDQDHHVLPASGVVPAGLVPYRTTSPLRKPQAAEPASAVNVVPLTRSPADTAGSAVLVQTEPEAQ